MTISQKKLEANRRNGERSRVYGAERRIKMIHKIIKLLQDGPKTPIYLSEMVGMNTTTVRDLLARMMRANVIRPHVTSSRNIRSYAICNSPFDLDALLASELALTTSLANPRRSHRAASYGNNTNVSMQLVVRGAAVDYGMSRPWYIECLFGPARGAA